MNDLKIAENETLWKGFFNIKRYSVSESQIEVYKDTLLVVECVFNKKFTECTLVDIEIKSLITDSQKEIFKDFLLTCMNFDLIEVNFQLVSLVLPVQYRNVINKLVNGNVNVNSDRENEPYIYLYKGEKLTLSDIAYKFNMTAVAVINKLNQGYSLEEIEANIWKKRHFETTYKGVTYDSIKELSEAHGMSVETYKRRIRYGQTMEQALETPSAKKGRRIKHSDI